MIWFGILLYLQDLYFVVLAERFTIFSIQTINIIIISVKIFSRILFSWKLCSMKRKKLNIIISGPIFVSSMLLLLLSFFLGGFPLEVIGFVVSSKCFQFTQSWINCQSLSAFSEALPSDMSTITTLSSSVQMLGDSVLVLLYSLQI